MSDPCTCEWQAPHGGPCPAPSEASAKAIVEGAFTRLLQDALDGDIPRRSSEDT